ncbi:unnamed protein product [Cuscuta europaea]|uniref:Uncharacterized protein n=1 Tax=Cuscuta europaea TaxID=41803 RepID=A0A9P0ZAS6_CUSEU|nr:unnamed protein product [Cuscuta europaea]
MLVVHRYSFYFKQYVLKYTEYLFLKYSTVAEWLARHSLFVSEALTLWLNGSQGPSYQRPWRTKLLAWKNKWRNRIGKTDGGTEVDTLLMLLQKRSKEEEAQPIPAYHTHSHALQALG